MPSNRRYPLSRAACAALSALLGTSLAQAESANANLTGLLALGSVASAGVNVRGDLLLASDGNFYVAASAGGASSVGSILQITPAGTATIVHSLAGADTEGAAPYSGLIQASDGLLYGTTYLGGTKNLGAVYKVTTSGTYTNLFSFTNESQGGFFPYTGLMQLSGGGDLYGTTLRGGANDAGTLYKLTLAGALTTVYTFNGADGRNPEGRLVQGPDGALYGTTLIGGAADRGTIYRLTTAGVLTTLYSFPALGNFNTAGVATNATGANPRSGLTLGSDGNFYGTTYQGGSVGYGTVYRVTPTGSVTVLHNFAGAPGDGAYPLATVSQGPDGSLVGTTEKGGSGGHGVTWRIDPAGNYKVLHPFTSLSVDGNVSYATLLPLNGYYYGISFNDLTYAGGSLFRLELPASGSLPVTLSTSQDSIVLGAPVTLTWSSPTATACTAAGAWADTTVATSGTLAVTPTAAGIYTYILSCVDGANVTRNAYAALTVTTPAAQPVDGGGTGGGGALGGAALALLGGALAFTVRQRRRA